MLGKVWVLIFVLSNETHVMPLGEIEVSTKESCELHSSLIINEALNNGYYIKTWCWKRDGDYE